MGVSENSGTPKSSILIEFSIIKNPFWGTTILGNHYIDIISPKGIFIRRLLLCPSNASAQASQPPKEASFAWKIRVKHGGFWGVSHIDITIFRENISWCISNPCKIHSKINHQGCCFFVAEMK